MHNFGSGYTIGLGLYNGYFAMNYGLDPKGLQSYGDEEEPAPAAVQPALIWEPMTVYILIGHTPIATTAYPTIAEPETPAGWLQTVRIGPVVCHSGEGMNLKAALSKHKQVKPIEMNQIAKFTYYGAEIGDTLDPKKRKKYNIPVGLKKSIGFSGVLRRAAKEARAEARKMAKEEKGSVKVVVRLVWRKPWPSNGGNKQNTDTTATAWRKSHLWTNMDKEGTRPKFSPGTYGNWFTDRHKVSFNNKNEVVETENPVFARNFRKLERRVDRINEKKKIRTSDKKYLEEYRLKTRPVLWPSNWLRFEDREIDVIK